MKTPLCSLLNFDACNFVPEMAWVRDYNACTHCLPDFFYLFFFSSAVLHVTIALVVNVCAGIVFLFVANMAVACEMSTDYQHIDDVRLYLQSKSLLFKIINALYRKPPNISPPNISPPMYKPTNLLTLSPFRI